MSDCAKPPLRQLRGTSTGCSVRSCTLRITDQLARKIGVMRSLRCRMHILFVTLRHSGNGVGATERPTNHLQWWRLRGLARVACARYAGFHEVSRLRQAYRSEADSPGTGAVGGGAVDRDRGPATVRPRSGSGWRRCRRTGGGARWPPGAGEAKRKLTLVRSQSWRQSRMLVISREGHGVLPDP
jgi:hypothetical protein